MAEIKLQFSVICETSDGLNIKNIINGFTPGIMKKFFIVNKWIWDQGIEVKLKRFCFYVEKTNMV